MNRRSLLCVVLLSALGLLCASATVVRQATAADVRFTSVEVWIDAGETPLEAWQVRLEDPSGRARIVGIEGGEPGPWAEPPYHDPAALEGGHIVLAAFTLDDALAGRQRVARVHLAVDGAAEVPWRFELEAAAPEHAPALRRVELVR